MIRTLTVLSLLALPVAVWPQGKLDEVRDAVDRPSPRDTSSSTANSSGDDSFLSILLAGLFSGGNDDGAAEPTATFSRYPYSDPGTSYLWLNRPEESGLSARAAVEVGSDFDGLNRA